MRLKEQYEEDIEEEDELQEEGEGAPANNIGDGNIALPDQSLFGKDTAKAMRRDHKEELKKFSDFIE